MAKLSYDEYTKKREKEKNKGWQTSSGKITYDEAQSRVSNYGSLSNYSRQRDEEKSKEIDDDTWKSIQDRYLNLVKAASGDKDFLRNAAGDRSRIGRMTPVMEKGDKWYSLPTVRNESSATKVLGARKNAFDKEASSLMSDLDKYSSALGDKGKDMKARLQQISGMYGGSVAQSQASDQFYGSFKDQDDYNRWSIGWDESRKNDLSFVDNAEKKEKRAEYYKNISDEIVRLQDQIEFHNLNGKTEKEIQDRIDQLSAEKLRYERFEQVGREDEKLRESPDFAEKSAFNYSETAPNLDVYERLAQSAAGGYDGMVDEEAYINSLAGIEEEGQYKKAAEKAKERTSWMNVDPTRVLREAAHVEDTELGIYQEGDTPLARYLDEYKKEKSQKVSNAQANGASVAPIPDNITLGPQRPGEDYDIVGEYIRTRESDTDDNPWVYVGGDLINVLDYGDGLYLSFMTDDDLQTYRYVLNTQGASAAKAWLDNHGDLFARRAEEEYQKKLKDESFLGLAVRNIASIPENLAGGVGAFVGSALGDGSYDATSWLQRKAEGVRAETAERINKATGNANLFGFSFGSVYQALMSGADSLAGASLLGKGYTYIMGTGAAAQKARQLYNEGATEEQIHKGAFVAGVTEVLTEKVSAEVFFSKFMESVTKNGWQGALKILTQAFTEGTEEMASDVLNTTFDNIIRRSQSEWNQTIQKALDEGKTKEEAERLVWADFANQLWQSFAGGAVSGGVMAGPKTMASGLEYGRETKAEGKAIRNADTTSSVLNMGKELVGDITDAKAKKSLQNAIESVEKKPTNKTVGNLSRAISEAINTVADEDTREALNIKYGAARVLGLDTRENTKLYNNADVTDKVSDTGSAVNTETGENIEISETNPIAKVENGEAYLNTDKGEVKQSEVKYSTEQQAKLLEYVSDLPTAVANAIVENYQGQENVEQYVSAMREGILHYGYNNVTAENVPQSTAFKSLSAEDQQYALAQGRALAAEDIKAAEAKVANLPSQLKRTAAADEVVYKAEKAPGASGTGGVVWTKGNVNFDTDINKANAAGARVVAAAFGKNIVLYDSKTVNDSTLKNANGKYVGSDGTIYLDINGNSDGGMMYTLSHEMTHEAEKWARREYRAFADFLIQNYAKKGVTVKELIDRKMYELKTEDEDLAYSEVIADAAENMLLDSDALDKLTELVEKHGTDKGWVEKLKSWIKTALDWIRSAYEHVSGASSREANEVAEFGKAVEKLQDLWSKAVVTAAQNRAAAVESEAKQTAKTTEQYSKKLSENEYARYMELAKDPVKNEAELQRMVEEAAELAMPDSKIRLPNGKLRKVYHGTNNNNFTVFDPQKIGSSNDLGWYGRGFYFAYTSGEASYYGDKIISAYLDIKKPYNFEEELARYKGQDTSVVGDLAAFAINLSEKFPQMASDLNITVYEWNGDQRIRKRVSFPEYANQILTVFNDEKLRPFKTTNRFGDERYSYAYGNDLNISALRSEYKSKEFAEKRRLDAAASYVNGKIFDEIDGHTPEHYMQGISRAFTDKIKELGYDGIIQSAEGDEAIAFLSSQIKSADPVTYDDNGNIIPLSERFNEEKDDIRYSLKQNRVRTPAEIRKEMSDLAAEIATLQKQYEQIENSDEYKTLYGAVIDRNLNDEQFNEALEKYSEWEKESEFAELHRKLGDLRKRSGELNREFSEALRNADVLEEQEKIKKSGLAESEYFIKQAVKEFGYTPYFVDAGYLLPNGKLLNFSGEKGRHFGIRGQDNRAIGTIFADSTGSSAMLRFMKDGNIRVMAEGPGVDISSVSEPTQEQYSAISRFIQDSKEKGYFSVDFTDENGTVVGKLEYEDSVAPSRVINDIKHFYQTGETREQSTVSRFHGDDFSRKSSESYAVRDIVDRALKRLDPNSAEYRAMAKYKTELDKLDTMRAELDEAIKSGDKQAETKLRNNIKTQNGILTRIENSNVTQNVTALKDVAKLTKDVKNLREMLRLQAKETGGTIASKTSAEAVAKELMDKYGVKRGKGEFAGIISRLYTELISGVNDRVLNVEYMRDLSRDAAEWIAEHQAKEYEGDDAAQEVLDYLKGKKVWLNDQQKGDIRHKYDGQLNKWMGRLSGYVTVTNDKSAMPLDDLWNDLSKQFPAEFGEVSDADQGWMLADKLSDLKERANHELVNHGLTDEQMEEWTDQVTDAVYESLWNIKPMETVADKYKKQITELKEKHRADMSALRKSFADTIREERSTMYAEAKERARDYREKIDTRRKLKKLAETITKRLINPQKGKYIPPALEDATNKVLAALDFETARGSSLARTLAELKERYAALQDKPAYTSKYDGVVDSLIGTLRDNVRGVAVKDMDAAQLRDVYDTLKAFYHVVTEAVKAKEFNSTIGEDRTIADVGKDLIKETRAVKEAKHAFNKYVQMGLRPSEFFERMGGYAKNNTWSQVYKMLNAGQRLQMQIEMEANEIFKETLEDLDYIKELTSYKDKDLVDFGLKGVDGEAVKTTRGMMLSYYMHTLNEDSSRHIGVGGMSMPDFARYYKNKTDAFSNEVRIPGLVGEELAAQYKKIQDRLNGKVDEETGTVTPGLNDELERAELHGMADTIERLLDERKALFDERDAIIEKGMAKVAEIRKNIEDNFLTDKDRAFIKQAQKFFDEYSKERLNEATRKMYDFEKARVKNYYPIHSDPNFLKAQFEDVEKDFSQENAGFMQDRVKAANAILLEDMSSVIDSQISKVARYAGLAPALREFGKLLSYNTGTGNADSVQKALIDKFGNAGQKYISNLMADLNGAKLGETTFLDRARSNLAAASLMMNFRTAIVQTASYPTAAAVVGYKALAKALALPDGSFLFKKADKEFIAKWSAALWNRNHGGADVMLHDVKTSNTAMAKVARKAKFLTGWIEAMDSMTVGRLWYAAEYYVRDNFKDLERGSDAYYEKTAEVFNEIVEKTQPNYTTLQRPDILRSKHATVRALTMFMTQRLQNANILYGAARRYKKYASDKKNGRNGVTEEDVRQARLQLWNAVSSQAVSAATIAGMKMLADALMHNIGGRRRDKDTGEITWESLVSSYLDDLTSTVMSNFIGGSEADSIIKAIATGGKYYGIEIGGFDSIDSAITKFVNLSQNLIDENKRKNLTPSDFTKLGFAMTTLLGVPAENAYKIGNGLWNHAQDIKNGKFGSFDAGYEIKNKQYANRMYNAIEAGDEKAFKEAWDSTKPDKGSTVDKTAAKNLTDAIETRYLDGDVSDEQAEEWLAEYCGKDSKQIYTTLEKWNLEKEGGEKRDYKVYDKFAEAVRTGKDLKAVIKEYKDAGYTDDALAAQITKHFKPLYIEASNAERAKMKGYLLNAYEKLGKDRSDKSDDIDKWVEN